MHSLVFWEQSKSVSVESNSEIVSSTGKETRLQWGSKTNPARILTQSDNKAWLESLCVNDEGIITGQIAEVPQCNEIEPSNEPPNQSNGSETAESAFADVLLMPGTDVRICPIALNNIRQERAKPSKMATALIKAIIGKERLRTMSVNDPRYSPIPESVMRTVERFVFQEFPGSAMTTRAFKRSITQLCTNLRARNAN